jgi:ATP-dependent Lon protease
MPSNKGDKHNNIKDKNKDKNKDKKTKYNKKKHSDTDDDSSVDSNGNMRGLIDYNYTSESDITYTSDSSSSYEDTQKNTRPPKRRASKKADIMIKEYLETKKNTSTTPNKNKKINTTINKNTKNKKQSHKIVTEDSEDSSSENEYDFEDDSDEDMTQDDDDDDDDDDDEEDEDGEEEEDEEDEEEEDEEMSDNSNILNLNDLLQSLTGGQNNMTPKRYNLKKESKDVNKFVKLLTAPIEDNSIDTQIDQYKALDKEKQKELLYALENRPTTNDKGVNLMLRILTMKLPPEIQSMILSKYNSLQSLDPSSNEYFKLRNWLDKVVSIPFGTYKEIPVRLEDGAGVCADFMRNAKKHLDAAVYGQDETKLQILQFISTKIANPSGRGLSLLLVGPPGVGKTSIIKNGIAKALGWPFQFISLGGDSDASTYMGHQLVYESSHCGKIVNSVIASKSMSTIMMFDEVDKISQTPKGEEVQNMLIHLTDPVQNGDFEDKYLSGVPIDLSRVMFIFSANDINKIDKVLLDRMMIIDLKGYDMKQKTVIAEQYLLPVALKDVNLTEKVAISREILQIIIDEYAKDENGVRELKRCIEQVVQKINMLRMYNSPELPFYIKDFALPFIVKKDHIKLFLKKRENPNAPPPGLYI